MRRASATAVLVVMASMTAAAAPHVSSTYRLYLKLADDHISESTAAPGDPIDTSINKFTVHGGQTTEIWIFDPNPLLFTYQATTVTSNTPDFDAALTFAKSLSVLLARFPASAASGGQKIVVDGLDLKQFHDDIDSLQKRMADLKKFIAMSTHPDQVQNMKDLLSDTGAMVDRVNAGYEKAANIKFKCGNPGATLTDDSGQPVSCDRAIVTSAAPSPTINQFITDALSIQSNVLGWGVVLRNVATAAAQVGVPRKIETRAYSTQTQTITVSVKAETRFQDFLTPEVKAQQTAGVREIKIQVDAYRAASLRPGVGFVLGFLRNPTFSTAKNGDTYKIVESDTQLTRYSVAAMLNVIPRGWDEPTFGGFFQLGVSPKNDETGFFFGAGVSAESVFTFGGGFMLQQTRQLAGGLTLSSALAKPEDLKTETVFKPAFYIHATVTLPSGK
jgi:hypothetical protein